MGLLLLAALVALAVPLQGSRPHPGGHSAGDRAPPSWEGTSARHHAGEDLCADSGEDLMAVVQAELAPWLMSSNPTPITRELLDMGWNENFNRRHDRFAIIGGKAYYVYGEDMSVTDYPPNKNVFRMLLALTRTHDIPDVEFVFNAGDGPIVPQHLLEGEEVPRPVMSYCKDEPHHDILVPHWHHFEHEVDEKLHASHIHKRVPWHNKTEVAFWRGTPFCPGGGEREDIYGRDHEYTPNHCPRVYFIELSKRLNDTAPKGPRDEPSPLDIKSIEEHVPIEEHVKYKYLVDLDGAACSTRFQKVLSQGSLVMKMDSSLFQYFARLLVPHKHYLPFWQTGLEDILEAVSWSKENDGRAREIAEAGTSLARTFLGDRGVLCYWALLLREYASLMAFKPSLGLYPGAVPVEHMMQKDICRDYVEGKRPRVDPKC